MVIERGGIRFGLFGMMGADSIQFTINPGALTFPDPIETAREMVQQLRAEGAEVIICMSHGGVREPKSGPITEGDDITLARAVPEIDVIVGGHTHTFMRDAGHREWHADRAGRLLRAGGWRAGDPDGGTRPEGRLLQPAASRRHDPGRSAPHQGNETFTAETSRIVFAPRGLTTRRAAGGDRSRLVEHVLRPGRLAAARQS